MVATECVRSGSNIPITVKEYGHFFLISTLRFLQKIVTIVSLVYSV